MKVRHWALTPYKLIPFGNQSDEWHEGDVTQTSRSHFQELVNIIYNNLHDWLRMFFPLLRDRGHTILGGTIQRSSYRDFDSLRICAKLCLLGILAPLLPFHLNLRLWAFPGHCCYEVQLLILFNFELIAWSHRAAAVSCVWLLISRAGAFKNYFLEILLLSETFLRGLTAKL